MGALGGAPPLRFSHIILIFNLFRKSFFWNLFFARPPPLTLSPCLAIEGAGRGGVWQPMTAAHSQPSLAEIEAPSTAWCKPPWSLISLAPRSYPSFQALQWHRGNDRAYIHTHAPSPSFPWLAQRRVSSPIPLQQPIHHSPAYLRELHRGRFEVIIKIAEEGVVTLPVPYHKGDEIHSRRVVVMPWIMWTIWR